MPGDCRRVNLNQKQVAFVKSRTCSVGKWRGNLNASSIHLSARPSIRNVVSLKRGVIKHLQLYSCIHTGCLFDFYTTVSFFRFLARKDDETPQPQKHAGPPRVVVVVMVRSGGVRGSHGANWRPLRHVPSSRCPQLLMKRVVHSRASAGRRQQEKK